MNAELARFYRCPATKSKLKLHVVRSSDDRIVEGCFENERGDRFEIRDGLPDFTWPRELPESDAKTRAAYEALASEYDVYAHVPFDTFHTPEEQVRRKIVDMLDLKSGMTVLEVGCGNGRGTQYLANAVGVDGCVFAQELSPAFLHHAMVRLKDSPAKVEFSLANASYLSFPDRCFDAAHHFGGINTFSEVKRCLSELARVVKPGGKVVVGDESMAPWLRDTEMGRIMMNSNPLLRAEVPLACLPVNAADVKVEWIMMGAYLLLEFTVAEREPAANYYVPIPGKRGGNHWIRYYGQLEGVTDETKKLAHRAREKSGKSMHEWLDRAVRRCAQEELNK
ncbi:MAG: class I SAM-dependent methyltransferase [Verrucomicrobia bacterium]|nr:class I SAM-dependent methyltransferase [Verrucomicrobiota bacterium]